MENSRWTGSTNQINRAHMGSERLTLHAQACIVMLRLFCLYGMTVLRMGVGLSLTLLKRYFSSTGLPFPASINGLCINFILLCPFWLSSLRVLLFSEEEMKEKIDLKERVGVSDGAGRSGRRRNCRQDYCMREKSIFYKKMECLYNWK